MDSSRDFLNPTDPLEVQLEPPDNRRLASLCGPVGEYLRTIESRLCVEISQRGHDFRVVGEPYAVQGAARLLQELYDRTEHGELSADCVHRCLQEVVTENNLGAGPPLVLILNKTRIQTSGSRQRRYLKELQNRELVFGIGPAGTGKTYLAVARAVQALEQDEVRRIVLVRPVVEAGERLGFLPGDLVQKIDPYLRPVYDALDELMGRERMVRSMESGTLEVAPLAYMRGRTLSDAFVILDEAQNATREQMKMFLTRIGHGARMVVTGDLSQSDLPAGEQSGLAQAVQLLAGMPEVAIVRFQSSDTLRHPLVQGILDAYGRPS